MQVLDIFFKSTYIEVNKMNWLKLKFKENENEKLIAWWCQTFKDKEGTKF